MVAVETPRLRFRKTQQVPTPGPEVADRVVFVESGDVVDAYVTDRYGNPKPLSPTTPAIQAMINAALDDIGESQGSAAASAAAAAASAAAASAAVSGTMPANTIKANPTGSTAAPVDATVAQIKALLAYAKSDIGLGSVDNTSDANKPVSTAMQTALDGKAASSHTHAQSDITGLTAALAGKAASSHNHAIADTTGLQAALDGKAASSHAHATSDVTGLDASLAALAAMANAHAATLTAMRALARPVPGTVGTPSLCYCAGRSARADGYEGFFEWVTGDQSASISADSYGGLWVAPDSHPTGSSGAWRRIVLDNTYRSHWFGDPAATDHAPHIQACINAAPAGAIIDTGPTRVKIATAITINKDNTRLRSIYEITAATAITAYLVTPSSADQALTLSGGSTIAAGSTSINVVSASGVAANDMILLYSDDLLAATTYKKGEIVRVRSVAGNTITFQSATMHNLTTNVSVYRVRPVRGFAADVDAMSQVASTVLHNGIQLSRVVDSKVAARGLNVYNATVSMIAVENSHIEYAGGNPGATTSNGFDYGVVLGNGCSNNKIVANGHNLRHVVACGATSLTGRSNSIDARGTDCKDVVVDSHPGFVDMDITFQAIGNRNGGSPASQPVGCTVQCGGIVRIKGMCDGYDVAAVVVQPFQNTDDSFVVDVTLANAGATATRGVNFDIQKIGGVINLIDIAVTGADAPGASGWGIGLTTVSAYSALEVEKLLIRQSKCSGAQFAIGIQTATGNTFRHIAFRDNNCEATTSKIVINNPGTIELITLDGNAIKGVGDSQKGFWLVGTGGTTAEVRVTGNNFEGVAANTSAIAIHCQQAPTAAIGASNRFKGFVAGSSPNFGDYRPAFNAVAGDYRTNP